MLILPCRLIRLTELFCSLHPLCCGASSGGLPFPRSCLISPHPVPPRHPGRSALSRPCGIGPVSGHLYKDAEVHDFSTPGWHWITVMPPGGGRSMPRAHIQIARLLGISDLSEVDPAWLRENRTDPELERKRQARKASRLFCSGGIFEASEHLPFKRRSGQIPKRRAAFTVKCRRRRGVSPAAHSSSQRA